MPPQVTMLFIGLAILTVHAYRKYVLQALPVERMSFKERLLFVGQTTVFALGFFVAMYLISYFVLYSIWFVILTGVFMGAPLYTILRHDVHDKLQAYRAYRQRHDKGTQA
jgi:hypothetical protein